MKNLPEYLNEMLDNNALNLTEFTDCLEDLRAEGCFGSLIFRVYENDKFWPGELVVAIDDCGASEDFDSLYKKYGEDAKFYYEGLEY